MLSRQATALRPLILDPLVAHVVVLALALGGEHTLAMLATGVVGGTRTGAARPLAVVLDFSLVRSSGDGAYIVLSLPGVGTKNGGVVWYVSIPV